jgi:hypothetical protein
VPARSDVFIGDLLEVMETLRVRTPADAQLVMRMLGLDSWSTSAAAEPAQTTAVHVDRAAEPFEVSAEPRLEVQASMPAPLPTAEGDSIRGEVNIQPLPEGAPGSLPPWHGATALPRAGRGVSPPSAPLFTPLKARALLTGLAARRAADGTLDMERLTAHLAIGALPPRLPQALAWCISGGLQVLVDDGPTMAPFKDDVAWLQQRLLSLLSAERILWLRFKGTPLRGCRQAGRRGRLEWRPVDQGQAVLVVSELGPLDAGAGVAEWLGFAKVARQAGLSLRTLVPWPVHRLPPALADAMHPITWDRSTTVGMVRQQVARASPAGRD